MACLYLVSWSRVSSWKLTNPSDKSLVGGISFGAGLLVLGLGTDDYIGFDLRDRTDPSAELIERVEREGRQHHALSARTLPFRRHRACDLFVKLQDRFELSSPTATPPSCTDDSIPFFCCCWPMHAATYRSRRISSVFLVSSPGIYFFGFDQGAHQH